MSKHIAFHFFAAVAALSRFLNAHMMTDVRRDKKHIVRLRQG